MQYELSNYELRGTLIKSVAGRQRLSEIDEAGARRVAALAAEKRRYKTPPKTVSGPFVGWDGEGREHEAKGHIYTLLANSTGAYIWNNNGLSTETCLTFLIDQRQTITSQANHVMYGGGYDANMILADFTTDELERLCVYGSIKWRQYTVSYIPRKYLRITGPTARRSNGTISITLWDTLGFFATSFLATVESWLKIYDPIMADMKAKRGTFTHVAKGKIVSYCLEECRYLAQIMEMYRESAKTTGYVPTRWDGAGAQASAMLRAHNIKQYKDNDVPREVHQAARYAYFGGRIEPVHFGHTERPVLGLDLNSAYPHAITKLPCLAHGKWVYSKHRPHWTDFALSLVDHVDGNNVIHPLPWRNKGGEIRYPKHAIGWYWAPEVGLLGANADIIHTWTWCQSCSHKPFAFIEDVYQQRLRYKAEGNPAQNVLRLGMNSIYGKTVQQIGWRDGKPPPYYQLEWGGYITSYTRTRLYRAAEILGFDNIISFETDGIYTVENDVSFLHDSNVLGDWRQSTYDAMTIVTSGVYWLHKDGGVTARYRGINKGSLTEQSVLDGWRNSALSVKAPHTLFVGMRLALRQPSKPWRQWVTDERELKIYPDGKRRPSLDCQCQGTVTPADHLHETWAIPGEGDMSAPYPTPFEMLSDLKEREESEDECEE